MNVVKMSATGPKTKREWKGVLALPVNGTACDKVLGVEVTNYLIARGAKIWIQDNHLRTELDAGTKLEVLTDRTKDLKWSTDQLKNKKSNKPSTKREVEVDAAKLAACKNTAEQKKYLESCGVIIS